MVILYEVSKQKAAIGRSATTGLAKSCEVAIFRSRGARTASTHKLADANGRDGFTLAGAHTRDGHANAGVRMP